MSAVLREPVVPWSWVPICPLDDLVPNVGVAALAGGRQIAIFRVVADDTDPGSVYAIDNRDLKSGANVLSRGIVGDVQGELVVASPIYKQHYSLRSGRCLEHPEFSVGTYPVRVVEGEVQVGLSTSYLRRAASAARAKLVVIGGGEAARRVVDGLVEMAPDLYDVRMIGAADPAVGVNRFKRLVRTRSGRELSYDRLLLATGAQAQTPPLAATGQSVEFSDLNDIDALLESARGQSSAIVIGAGLLALEAANGLLRQGLRVTVVAERLMQGQLDASAAELLRATLEKRGIRFVTALSPGPSPASGRGELMVMAAGIRPNIELAQKIGLRCEQGVLVNDTLQTFDPRIYAVGACVQHRHITHGLATPLEEQVRVCASQLAELGHSRYRGVGAARLAVSGVDLYSAGDIVGGEGTEDLVYRDTRRGVYKRLVVTQNRVTGVVLYGDTRDANWYFDLIRNRTDVSGKRDRLLFGPDAGG
jgi:NAD(P)H-dependent nitrite reductase small subunit